MIERQHGGHVAGAAEEVIASREYDNWAVAFGPEAAVGRTRRPRAPLRCPSGRSAFARSDLRGAADAPSGKGSIEIVKRKDGLRTFWARGTDGRRHRVRLGTDRDGWTPARPQVEIEDGAASDAWAVTSDEKAADLSATRR